MQWRTAGALGSAAKVPLEISHKRGDVKCSYAMRLRFPIERYELTQAGSQDGGSCGGVFRERGVPRDAGGGAATHGAVLGVLGAHVPGTPSASMQPRLLGSRSNDRQI